MYLKYLTVRTSKLSVSSTCLLSSRNANLVAETRYFKVSQLAVVRKLCLAYLKKFRQPFHLGYLYV
jgi:hypothetical protein